MSIPLQITARDFELTESIEAAIRERAEKLDRFYDRIIRCRVVLEAPHRRRRKGVLYQVNLEINVPGNKLTVNREPHEDIYTAVKEAFETAKRRLQEYAEQQRGEVKIHTEPPRARIRAIFHEAGYGFLATTDEREIYFHENSVLGGRFAELEVGMAVRFVEAMGEKGPQASTVEMA
jgi:ribosomal subunit interface protein